MRHHSDGHGHGHGHGHTHDPGGAAMAHLHSDDGLRTAVIATFGLLLTGAVELAIFMVSGSAGLLADALHNLGDVSTTIAIAVAFLFSKRQASERYPYGLHRAEDLAGLFVLLVMAVSAVLAGWESLLHLAGGHRPQRIVAGMAAALVGAAGNELVARYKIATGHRIGSVSLAADGRHSRQDALVSLAAVAGLVGAAAGWERADGLAGLAITAVLVAVLISTARGVLERALDAVDPDVLAQITRTAMSVPAVGQVHDVRARWSGRALWATLAIELPEVLPLGEAHAIAEQVRHALLHDIPALVAADIHMDPGPERAGHHAATAHHAPTSARSPASQPDAGRFA